MKPSKEQIEAIKRGLAYLPNGYSTEDAIAAAYAAGCKAGMEEAAAIAQKEGNAWKYAAHHQLADGAYHVEGCIRAAMEADK